MAKVVKIIETGNVKIPDTGKKGYDGDQITNTSNTNTGHENTSGQGQQQSGGKKEGK
jgi:hypothetical protein